MMSAASSSMSASQSTAAGSSKMSAGGKANPPLRNVLTRGKLVLCWAGLPLALAAVAFGLTAVVCLLDEHKARAIWQSPLAEQVHQVVRANPVLLTFFFNGGLIGMLTIVASLSDHYAALKIAAETKKE